MLIARRTITEHSLRFTLRMMCAPIRFFPQGAILRPVLLIEIPPSA